MTTPTNGNGWRILDKNSPVSLGLVLTILAFSVMAFMKMAEVQGAVDLTRNDSAYMRQDINEISDSVKEIERSIKGLPSRDEFSALLERVRVLEAGGRDK